MRSIEARHFESVPLILDRVFLVSLPFQNELEDNVCVDTTRRLILDIADLYSLSLTSEALFLCAGGNGSYSRIGKIRELVTGRSPKQYTS